MVVARYSVAPSAVSCGGGGGCAGPGVAALLPAGGGVAALLPPGGGVPARLAEGGDADRPPGIGGGGGGLVGRLDFDMLSVSWY